MQSTPHAKEPIAPILRPVGIYQPSGGYPRCVIEVKGSLRLYRALELCSLGTLLEIHPDISHWRLNFPHTKRKVDAAAAGAWIVRECQRLGVCDVPEEFRAGKAGRPKGSKDTYQRVRAG